MYFTALIILYICYVCHARFISLIVCQIMEFDKYDMGAGVGHFGMAVEDVSYSWQDI